jgi:S-adenosylmethionine:diacylglycerol 3-amino-3-carboxypropyl transferase
MTETRTAQIDLSEDGLLIVRIRAGAIQTLTDAEQNLSTAMAETLGRRRPLLIDMRLAEPLDAAVRHHYSGRALVDAFSALALLVDASPLGRMMGNVYLRVARPGIPTQLFAEEDLAIEWLTGFRT